MSSVNTLRVGQKVVCIDDKPEPGRVWAAGDRLEKGAIYTVGDLCRCRFDGAALIKLIECPRPAEAIKVGRIGYLVTRFRPLVTKTQAEDVQLFRLIANEAEKPLVNLTDALNRSFLAVSDWEE